MATQLLAIGHRGLAQCWLRIDVPDAGAGSGGGARGSAKSLVRKDDTPSLFCCADRRPRAGRTPTKDQDIGIELDGTRRRGHSLGACGLNCHRPLLRAKSIAIGIAPHRHRYAHARRWQFKILGETWTKLSLSQPTEEDSCGGAYDILLLPITPHAICAFGAVTETDFSFCSQLLPIRFLLCRRAVSRAVPFLAPRPPPPETSARRCQRRRFLYWPGRLQRTHTGDDLLCEARHLGLKRLELQHEQLDPGRVERANARRDLVIAA